jgi:hypothetical protein
LANPLARSAISQAAKEFVHVASMTAAVAWPRIGLGAQVGGDILIEIQAQQGCCGGATVPGS